MRKNTKGIFIISFVLVLLIVAAYFLIFKNKIPQIPNNKTTTTTKEAIPDDVSEITKLANYFTYYNVCETGIELNTEKEVTPSNLPKTAIYSLLTNYLELNGLSEEYNETRSSNSKTITIYKKDDMEMAARTLFGSNYLQTHSLAEEFNALGGSFTLSGNEYKGIIPNNGCAGSKYATYKLEDALYGEDTLELIFSLYYREIAVDTAASKIVTNIYVNKNDETPICEEKDLNSYGDSFKKYHFNFHKEGNNYYLYSIK